MGRLARTPHRLLIKGCDSRPSDEEARCPFDAVRHLPHTLVLIDAAQCYASARGRGRTDVERLARGRHPDQGPHAARPPTPPSTSPTLAAPTSHSILLPFPPLPPVRRPSPRQSSPTPTAASAHLWHPWPIGLGPLTERLAPATARRLLSRHTVMAKMDGCLGPNRIIATHPALVFPGPDRGRVRRDPPRSFRQHAPGCAGRGDQTRLPQRCWQRPGLGMMGTIRAPEPGA